MSEKLSEHFLILSIFDSTSIKRAEIRSLLSNAEYIEIENTFFINSHSKFRDFLAKALKKNEHAFSLVFVYSKIGNRFLSNELSSKDENSIITFTMDT